MIIEIKPISDRELLVANKRVILDSNDKWIATNNDLSINHIKAFQNYKINYIDNRSIKSLPKVTYNY